eukprot:TRINITY_DN37451_c0_g1_i1.p1 TRINITY_DN37451_c0_g1~~TRINITY_DN37451_c0_g1_i1.p1  ORF type:complete len:179 (+),score=51.43 TRINITY_DN37451_c0_g1_i1:27-539(+)
MSEESPHKRNDEDHTTKKKKKNRQNRRKKKNDQDEKKNDEISETWGLSSEERIILEANAHFWSAVVGLVSIAKNDKTSKITMLNNYTQEFFGNSTPSYQIIEEGRSSFRCRVNIMTGNGLKLEAESKCHTSKAKAKNEAAQELLSLLIQEIAVNNNRDLIVTPPPKTHNL